MSAGAAVGDAARWSPEHVQEALRVLGGRWVPSIFAALADGPTRRADLRDRVGAADKVLTETLQRLVDRGLVTRAYTPGVPAHAEYALTERARAAWPALAAVQEWAADAAPPSMSAPSEALRLAVDPASDSRSALS